LARYDDPIDGLYDALRLSQGMSRKAAIAGTRTGGAKCVIAAPASESLWPLEGERREDVLRDLVGRRIVIVGLGGVGELLARRLAQAGAQLIVTDVDLKRKAVAAEVGAQWIAPEAAQRHDCEILALVARLGDTAREVLRRAELERSSTLQAAIRIAYERLKTPG
jgi:glutamate dehydrogenase/leucine dehydrogenase